MNDAYDRIAYLVEDPTRVEVALACRGTPATKAQIAKQLDRAPGGITAVKTLENKGVLQEAGNGPSTGGRKGGRRWLLDPGWEKAADRAAIQLRTGLLADDLEIILIQTTDVLQACQLLMSDDAPVSWGVPLKGEQMGLLLCPSNEPDEARTARLLKLLADRDVRPVRLHLPMVMSETQLREWAQRLATGGRDSLPSPH